MKIKYSKKLLLIFTFVACNHAILSMNTKSKTAIQIQKHIYNHYINIDFSSTEPKKNGKNITDSFKAYLKENQNISTIIKNTHTTKEITAQFKKNKKKEKEELMDIPSMLLNALDNSIEQQENSFLTPCLTWFNFITTLSDSIHRNQRTKNNIETLSVMKKIWMKNLIYGYQKTQTNHD